MNNFQNIAHGFISLVARNVFRHTREIFKEQKILNIYQLNILSNIIFMHCVENKTAPFIFLTKFCKLSHPCPTNFLAHNLLVPTLKVKKKKKLNLEQHFDSNRKNQIKSSKIPDSIHILYCIRMLYYSNNVTFQSVR